MNTTRLLLCITMIGAVGVSGCGGGSGGGGGGGNGQMTDMPPASMTETSFASLTSTTATNAQRTAAQVADAIPSFGSITQSSNAINNITQDRVTITTTYGATQNTYSIQNGSTWSISTADGNPQRIATYADDTGRFKGSELNKQVSGGTLWVDVYSDIEAPTTSTRGTPKTISAGDSITVTGGRAPGDYIERGMSFPGRLNGMEGTIACESSGCSWNVMGSGTNYTVNNADGLTFTPDTGSSTPTGVDTDYLSGGIWLFVPNNQDDADSYVGGAFADGSDPFTQSALPAVIGTARYEGEATGIYSATENNATEIGYFDANATLDADFGDGSGLGTISGRLTGFEVDGNRLEGSLTLDTTNIGASNNGFFEGNLSGSSQGTDYTGRWGGAFFGNGETDNRPGSVGGTFGGRSTDSSQSFVGVFGAYKR